MSVRPSTRHPSFGHGSTAAGAILSYKNSLDFWPTITKQHFSSFIGQRSTTRPPKNISTLTYGLCVCVWCGSTYFLFFSLLKFFNQVEIRGRRFRLGLLLHFLITFLRCCYGLDYLGYSLGYLVLYSSTITGAIVLFHFLEIKTQTFGCGVRVGLYNLICCAHTYV